MTRLAVLVPVFNDQAGIEAALASLARDGASFAAFVVDDGSTPPIRLPDGLPFSVTLVRLERNGGITRALNAGLRRILAEGGYDYVARLDADDLTLPGRLAAQMAFLDRHLDHAVVGAQADFVDPEGRLLYRSADPTRHEDLARVMRYRNGLTHPVVMIRLAALADAGLYDERAPGSEDYDLWLRLLRRHKLANLGETYLRRTIGPHQLTARRFRVCLGRLRLQLRHFAPRSPHAYLGLARSAISLLLPRGPIIAARRLRTALAGGGRRLPSGS